jgi:hypothetical protein
MAADFKLEAILEFKDQSEAGLKQARENATGLERAVQAAGKAIAAYLVAEGARATYELARLGAEAARTEQTFEAISGGAIAASERLEAMRSATRGAISDQEAMAAANRLMQMGLANSTEELEGLTTMAVRLGTAMGRDAGESIEEFALLLANQSIPRLDTFGISAGNVRSRIRELQEETTGLTREQAFLQATQEEGIKAMARLGEASIDTQLQVEKQTAAWQNLKAEVGQQLAPTLGAVSEETAGLTQRMTDWYAAAREGRIEAGFFQRTIDNWNYGLTGTSRLMQEAAQQQRNLAAASKLSAGQAADYEAMNNALRVTSEVANPASDALSAAASAAADLSAAGGGVVEKFADLNFDTEALYEMAIAMGANAEQVLNLGVATGQLTMAQAAQIRKEYGIVQAYVEGNLTAQQAVDATNRYTSALQTGHAAMASYSGETHNTVAAVRAAETAGRGAAAGIDQTGSAAERARGRVSGLSGDASALENNLRGASSAADAVKSSIESIPSVKNVEIRVRRTGAGGHLQSGTRFARGGMAIVGERGPEAMFVPRGAQVFPTSSPQSRAAVRQTTNNIEGDTVIIQDKMAAAMYLDERRRRRRERAEARM